MTEGFRFPPLELKVWGEYACFTRPEAKVERVSYPVMTPSAARGVLEAVFWKPEFRWRVLEIAVLRPIRYVGFVRNEVSKTLPAKEVIGAYKKGKPYHYFADEDRQQRHTLALREVAYIIRAQVELAPHARDLHEAKYRDQFCRRVARGQCHHIPYLGCREFAASFARPGPEDTPLDLNEDLGRMLFDIRYQPDGSGRGTPLFFEARLEGGVLRVPQELYEQMPFPSRTIEPV